MLTPTIQQNLGRSIRAIVAIAVGDEQEMRGRPPDTAKSNFQSTDKIQVVGKDLSRVEPAIVVGILEDEDSVPGLLVGHTPGVGIGFGDPESPAVAIAIAIGWTTSGSPAKSVTLNPGGRSWPARPVQARDPRVQTNQPSWAACAGRLGLASCNRKSSKLI